MRNEEKLRLLIVDQGYKEGHANGVSHGAATVFAKWPSYIASAIWCSLCIVSLATLLTLIIFMALFRQGKIIEPNVFIPQQESRYMVSYNFESEFCSQMIARKHEKRQEIPERDLKVFDSGNNIFYMVMKSLDKFSSCSIESVARQCPDKNIFLMFLKPVENMEFETVLKNEYLNFNLINVNGKKILRGSPFEGKWKGDNRSLFEAALLTVWQFGGTVLSEYLLMLDRKMYETRNINCKVDPELIFCPMQCASFLYDLIGETLKSSRNESMDVLLDRSIKAFCGSEHFIKTGCLGVSRIDDAEMCNELDDHCMFLRTRTLNNDNTTVWGKIMNKCPVTKKHYKVLQQRLNNDHITSTVKLTSIKVVTNSTMKSQTSQNITNKNSTEEYTMQP